MKAVHRILETSNDKVQTVIRVTLGVVMLPHGLQKLLGWFGGHGFEGTMGFFTGQLGIPAVFAFLAIVAESFGAMALIVGALSRVSAIGVSAVMAVALQMHLGNGFFMNWGGKQAGEGFEFHLLALALGVAVIIRGAGAYSVDQLISRRLGKESSGAGARQATLSR